MLCVVESGHENIKRLYRNWVSPILIDSYPGQQKVVMKVYYNNVAIGAIDVVKTMVRAACKNHESIVRLGRH